MPVYNDASFAEVNDAVHRSAQAFKQFKLIALKDRSHFLYAIADELEAISSPLIITAHQETHLEKGRLEVELKRTLYQLTSYADACAAGTWLDIRIDAGDKNRHPPKPDLRKILIPLGPVVVFGASNFPFAYSTAGGDTACALAAGCTVILKAHPAHAETSETVAAAIHKAACRCGLPKNIFIHLHGAAFETGKALVQHPVVKAVGFTGSFEGGKALYDLANQREVPIPVFAEMGSVNPVFLLPQKLSEATTSIAAMLSGSITQSAGQFCTNPGVVVGIESEALNHLKKLLGDEIKKENPVAMLHSGIAKSFRQKRSAALQAGVAVLATNEVANEEESIPTLAEITAQDFLTSPLLHKEVFGPYSLLVVCDTAEQMFAVAKSIEGQLTCTLFAADEEAASNKELIEVLKEKCGRLIFNGVPTGVEVALGMHHGGPYPATTDSRFTAVGADGIKRFARPICYQGWTNALLPEELKNENPLGLWRTVNNELTKEPVPAH